MKHWQIKDISDKTLTSVRMLRHYDKIGLLVPSFRADNGYRCYTKKDLAKLQQIIALKYFGLSLNHIKDIIDNHDNVYAHLQAQKKVIEAERERLLDVDAALQDVLSRLSPFDTPDSNDSMTLISRFHMTKNIKDTLKQGWAGKFLNEEQFEHYLKIYERFPEDFKKRDEIIQSINEQRLGTPESAEAIKALEFLRQLGNKMKAYIVDDIKFSSSLMQDMQSGKISQLETTPEATLWLSRAMLFYTTQKWQAVYQLILDNVQEDPESLIGKKVANAWDDVLNQMLEAGPKSFLMGSMIWNDLCKQQHQLKDKTEMPSPQEMAKDLHVPLFFNPEACQWITKALLKYSA